MRRWIWIALLAGFAGLICLAMSLPREVGDRPASASAGPGVSEPMARSGASPPTVGSHATLADPNSNADFPEAAPDNSGFPDIPVWVPKDAEGRAAAREEHLKEGRELGRKRVATLYEDVERDLQIGSRSTGELHAMLVEHFAQGSMPSELLEVAPADHGKYFKELRARQLAELEALLGARNAAALGVYRHTIEARYEVEEMRAMLEREEMPVTESQRRLMVEAMIVPGVLLKRREYSEIETVHAVRREIRARVEQNDQQLLAISRSILDEDQWDEYAYYLEDRLEEAIELRLPDFAREQDDQE